MISGRRVIAFTPAGRQRYMEILVKIVCRAYAAGQIDEWVIFDNTYNDADAVYTGHLPMKLGNWVSVIKHDSKPEQRNAGYIHFFYQNPAMKDTGAVYVRLDDDIVYLGVDAIPRLVYSKISNEDRFLVYPVIVNNTRMSYWLQQHGRVPREWGPISDHFLDPIAWRSPAYDHKLQLKALDAIKRGTFEAEFSLPNFTTTGRSTDRKPNNHISVNCFAIDGRDMASCIVPPDEEGYLSDKRPLQLGRFNFIQGDAVVSHFAYHPQTVEMEATGLLEEYRKLAEQ